MPHARPDWVGLTVCTAYRACVTFRRRGGGLFACRGYLTWPTTGMTHKRTTNARSLLRAFPARSTATTNNQCCPGESITCSPCITVLGVVSGSITALSSNKPGYHPRRASGLSGDRRLSAPGPANRSRAWARGSLAENHGDSPVMIACRRAARTSYRDHRSSCTLLVGRGQTRYARPA